MFDLNNGVAIGDAVANNPFLSLTTSNGGKNWISSNYNDHQAGYTANLWRPINFINPNTGYFILSHIEYIPELLKTTNSRHHWLFLIIPEYILYATR